MKTLTVNLYSIEELKDQFPDAYARALRDWQNASHEIPWQEETIESLKECVKAAGIKLRDYSLGAYNRGNHISITFTGCDGCYNDDIESMTRARAMAWLENNLLSSLRIPWTGKGRNDVRKYGKGYRPGLIRPCPFTGYCADEDYIESLQKAIRGGCTLKEAFEGLADVCARLLEQDSEEMYKEDYFFEDRMANEVQFTEDGERY